MHLNSNQNFLRIKLFILVLLVLSALPTQAGDINKWIDAQGNVHYGTQPPQDLPATKIAKPSAGSGPTAIDTPEVVLYSTRWCGYCRQARAFMNDNNIRFTERDIENDLRGKLEYDRLGGRGVPFLVRDDNEILRGFNIKSYRRFFSQN